MGDLGNIFAACMGDMLTTVTKATVDTMKNTVHSATDVVKNTANKLLGHGDEPKYKHAKAEAFEDMLLSAMESFVLKGMVPHEKLKETVSEQKEFFKLVTDFRAVSPNGKVLLKEVKCISSQQN